MIRFDVNVSIMIVLFFVSDNYGMWRDRILNTDQLIEMGDYLGDDEKRPIFKKEENLAVSQEIITYRQMVNMSEQDKLQAARQVTLTHCPGDKKKKATCWRLGGDTLVMVYMVMKAGYKKCLINCFRQSELQQQLQEVQKAVNDSAVDVSYVTILCNEQEAIHNYWTRLGNSFVNSQIYKTMFYSQSSDKNKDDFECILDQEGVSWSSVFYNFQKYSMK